MARSIEVTVSSLNSDISLVIDLQNEYALANGTIYNEDSDQVGRLTSEQFFKNADHVAKSVSPHAKTMKSFLNLLDLHMQMHDITYEKLTIDILIS
jgi:hypothetical protein